jgi:carbon-monoxide dehydrogenase large subunit
MAVLRSPHAHADILSIGAAAARAMPGVMGAFTAEDLAADGVGALPCSLSFSDGTPLVVPNRLPLCTDRVRHVGDPLAIVVARSREAAISAVEIIDVVYEVRKAVVDPARAGEPHSPEIWDEAPGNAAFRYRRGDARQVEAALASARHVVELSLVNNRIAAAAIEPRTAIGYWEDESSRGGGFGMKNVTYPEYALVLWAARRLGAPVRWTADRIEDFTSGVHARDNLTTAKLALDGEGRFLALAVETVANLGAYVSSLGPGSSTTAPTPAMGGLYEIPCVSMDVRGVFTNTAPVDAYRGAGKPEANYVIERLVDVAALRLGMDPVDLRRKNLIRTFPYRNAMGFTVDSGDCPANLERALEVADHGGFPARRAAALARGRLRGIGVGCFLETSRGQPDEEAWIRLAPDGTIGVAVGTQSNGQGHETSFIQLVSAKLGLPATHFRFIQGDTREVLRGGGHGGARSLHMGGTALLMAADDLLEKARPLAARFLQASSETVSYADGAFRCGSAPGAPERHLDLPGLARALAESGQGEGLEGHGDHRCDSYTFPNGCHVAEVEVDPETGQVSLVRYVAVDDYGTLVNPLLTEGQVHGGIAQGVGQALMEHAVYESGSGQNLSATFMDYAVPRGADLPNLDVRFVEVPTSANPIGAKGAGQAGAIAAPHTVINAVVDALGSFGVEHIDMPATPEKVWAAIRTGAGGSG